jgi:hypothetical protein
MNLPDAPIAHEGFFATHFFTVSDLDKSPAGRLRTGSAAYKAGTYKMTS